MCLSAQSDSSAQNEFQWLTIFCHSTATEAAAETTETPAAETTTEAAKEETKKEVVPVENGQLEHKGSNFPKYASILTNQTTVFAIGTSY